jgi:diguanylate cyclase
MHCPNGEGPDEERGAMTARLDLGIDGEPELLFQPAVDIAAGRLLGFEALLRWNDPVRGVLAPDVILSWAEANGHMTTLNAWILFEACSQAVQWGSSLQLSVHCSTSEFQRRKATVAMVFALEQSGLNPDQLTVEVAQTALCNNLVIGELHALSNLGIQLAVDNVGPNWTSIDYPQHVALNMVKIDRRLVEDLECVDGTYRGIIDNLIRASHLRGFCAVAEGVETAGQMAVLRELGADVGQGYFFAPPLSGPEARSLTNAPFRSAYLARSPALEEQAVGAQTQKAPMQEPSAEFRVDLELPPAPVLGERPRYDTCGGGADTNEIRRRNRLPAQLRRGRHSSS